MLRFLKKHRKSHKKPVPPENLTHQTTDIGAERGSDPESEYRSRKISGLIRPVGLIQQWRQIPTTEGILGLQTRMRINSSPRRMPQFWVPDKEVATQVSVVGCGYRGRF